MANVAIANVVAVVGKAFARNEDGELREIRPGDVILEGETVVTPDGAYVELSMMDGNPFVVSGVEEMAITRDLVAERAAGPDEASVEDESIDALLTALEGDGDIGDVLEATAAGAGGGGGAEGGGHSFIRLGRIVEGTDEFGGLFAPSFTADEAPVEQTLLPVDAIDDVETTEQGEPVVIDVLDNDIFVEGSIVTSVTQPANGTVVINSDNTVTYTPNPGFFGEDTFTYTAISPTGEASDTANVTVTIPGSPPPPPPPELFISIDDVTVVEGDTATLTVSLSGASDSPVTVQFDSLDDTATVVGGDYDPDTGTITFAPGTTEVTISFATNEDQLQEGTEQFLVNLSNASGATIADPQGVVTIVDDFTPVITINDVIVTEGETAEVTLSLSAAVDEPVSVDFASADDTATVVGGDYNPNTGTITFAPGTTEVTVFFGTNTDDIQEAIEQFLVNLTNPVNATIADPQGTVQIIDATQPPPPPPPPPPPVDNPVDLDVPTEGEAGTQVSEAGLPERGLEPAGSAGDDSETTAGTISFGGADAPLTVSINGEAVTAVGQTFAGQNGFGTLTITSIAAGTIGYSYTLADNTAGDATADTFAVSVSDVDGDTESDTLTISIVDDVPSAQDDFGVVLSGGVLDVSAENGLLSNDTTGADDGVVTDLVPSEGNQGSITWNADGSYVYTAAANATYTDTFTYTLTDGDGDITTAVLTIDVTDGSPNAPDESATVFESALDTVQDGDDLAAGTVTGSNPDSPLETVTGQLDSVDPNGDTLTYTAKTVAGTYGTLQIFEDGSYIYTLTTPFDTTPDAANDAHTELAAETFSYDVQDPDGNSATGTLTIDIVDDVPTARADVDMVDPSDTSTSGNVISGVGVNAADTVGADDAGVVGVVAGNTNADYDDATSGQPATVGAVIAGTYGTLTLAADGSYTYNLTAENPGAVSDVFTYTLKDGDGDLSSTTLTINVDDDGVTVDIPTEGEAGTQVFEAGLPARDVGDGPEPEGSGEAADPAPGTDNSETTTGQITFTGSDTPLTISINGSEVAVNDVIQGQNGFGSLTVTAIDLVAGTLDYSYTLADNTSGDATEDTFAIQVDDADNDSASGTLTIDIVDDMPTARPDVDMVDPSDTSTSGNVISGVGVNAADTVGADDAGVVGVVAGNTNADYDDATSGQPATVGAVIAGTYGTLTLAADGSYTYNLTAENPGAVSDVFTYTLKDGDGDLSSTTLTINVDDDGVTVDIPTEGEAGTQVFEAGLPARDVGDGSEPEGSGEAADPAPGTDNSETTTGQITFTGSDTPLTISINGSEVAVNDVIQGQNGFGSLTVTAIDLVAGTLDYSYTLADNTSGDATEDTFAIQVDDADNDSASGTLTIDIVDDMPTARPDVDMVDPSDTSTSGNVITGVGVDAADTVGADDAGVVGVVAGNTNADYDDATSGQPATVGAVIAGTYGTLTLAADGSYTYNLTAENPGAVSDVFTYTLKDGDGDLSSTTLTINVDDDGVTVDIPTEGEAGTQVFEAGLPARDVGDGPEPEGSGEAADPAPGTDNSETTTGQITFTGSDTPLTISINGSEVAVNDVIQGQNGFGSLTVTAIDLVAGTLDYSYTLADNTSGDNTEDTFAILVSDADNDTAGGTLTIDIVDDVPTANDDGIIATLSEPAVGVNLGSAASLLLTNDVFGADGEGSPSINLVSTDGTAGGTISINGDGDLIYTGDVPNGQTLNDTFFYTITDGDGDVSPQASFTVQLTDVDEPPTINVTAGEDEVYEAYLTGGSGLPAGVTTPLTASGTITLADSDGLDDSVSIRVGGVTGDVVTMAALLSLEASGTPITLSNADVEYGQLQLTGYNSGTGVIQWQYTLQTNVDNDDAQEVLGGATDTLDLDDFTVEISDDGTNWVGPATGTVTVYDDAPVFDADNTLLISAPDNSLNIADIVDWTFGADGFASISSDSGSAVIASQSADGVVINLLDSGGNIVGILTLNADGTDSLEVVDRPPEIIEADISSASVSAGGPQESYQLFDADSGLTTTVTGSDLVNPSTQGWAISDNQVDPMEDISFAFSGAGVAYFKFDVEGFTGGQSANGLADITVTVNYVGGGSTILSPIALGDGQTFDSRDYAAQLDASKTIASVDVLSSEPSKGDGFRLNNVVAGAIDSNDPSDLNFDFTLDIVDGDGDVASQDFDITLRGSEEGDISVTTATPITIDLGNDGVEYLGREAGIVFTDQVTGEVVNTAWIGSGDGLLVFDADNSGTVNEAKEFVFTEWSETAKTDMEAVAEVFDTNKDGVLDAQDEQFSQFAVWQDADGDGFTDAGELSSLVDLGVQSIALNYAEDSQSGTAADGDVFIHGQSTVTWTDGSTSTADDASFAQDPLDLKDLIGDSEDTDLSSYLNVSYDGSNTIVAVSNSGAFEGNAGDADKVDHTITLEGIDLVSGHDDMASIIQNMLDSGKLTVDQ